MSSFTTHLSPLIRFNQSKKLFNKNFIIKNFSSENKSLKNFQLSSKFKFNNHNKFNNNKFLIYHQNFRFSSNIASSSSKIFQQNNYKTLFLTSASVVGSVILLDGFLNRDKRAEPLSPAQRDLLNSSFQHTGIGLAVTSVLAKYMFKNGFTARMMAMNPLAVAGLGLVGSIGSMMCTLNTSPDNTLPKYAFWLSFTACQAATLSPLYYFAPAVLSRAALYTVGVVGSLSYIGATAKNDRFLFLGGPLLAGVSVVALSSLAPLVLPVTAARTLMVTESISLYGGLAVFGGFVLYDTQKILHHGQLVQQGRMKADPVNESVGLIMDSINIFIRLVQILTMQSNRK